MCDGRSGIVDGRGSVGGCRWSGVGRRESVVGHVGIGGRLHRAHVQPRARLYNCEWTRLAGVDVPIASLW